MEQLRLKVETNKISWMPDRLTLQALNKYKKYNLNFHPLEVVSRYHDTPLQEGEKLSYLFNFRPNICKP